MFLSSLRAHAHTQKAPSIIGDHKKRRGGGAQDTHGCSFTYLVTVGATPGTKKKNKAGGGEGPVDVAVAEIQQRIKESAGNSVRENNKKKKQASWSIKGRKTLYTPLRFLPFNLWATSPHEAYR